MKQASLRVCCGGLSVGIGMYKTSRWSVTIVGFIIVCLAVWYLQPFASNISPAKTNSKAEPESPVSNSVSSFRHTSSLVVKIESLGEPTADPTAEPTTRPSNAPTFAHSPMPSAEPTAEPSAEPTADPTAADTSFAPSLASSVAPSVLPSLNPTIQPSRPTVRPSKIPTLAPSRTPSMKPSFRPTPIPGSPTTRPTTSTRSPTAKPTMDPYPVETLLVFNSSLRCDNIDSFTFFDDPRIEIAFVSAFASTMQNISASMVRVLNVTDIAGVRRLSSINSPLAEGEKAGGEKDVGMHVVELHHSNMHALASSISIVVQVNVVLETLGYTASQSNEFYTLLTHEASANIGNNEFSTDLGSDLLLLGVASSITPISSSYRASSYSTKVLQTASPSVAPTLSPSVIALTVAESSRGGTTVVDIIVIITVIGSVAMLLGLLYGAHYEKEKVKQNKLKVAPLPGRLETSIVPGP